jgi:hypothetical protein
MLPLISFLLAALPGQASPSLSDPPPCAAVNIKGCLPGYKPLYDRYGRLLYVRDSDYVPPLAQASPAPLRTAPSQGAPAEQPAPWAYPKAPRLLQR